VPNVKYVLVRPPCAADSSVKLPPFGIQQETFETPPLAGATESQSPRSKAASKPVGPTRSPLPDHRRVHRHTQAGHSPTAGSRMLLDLSAKPRKDPSTSREENARAIADSERPLQTRAAAVS
jgi:hypothetical protein